MEPNGQNTDYGYSAPQIKRDRRVSQKWSGKEVVAVAKSTRIWFSKERVGKSSGKPEVDTYRQSSDSPKGEKIDHNPVTPGYGKDPVNVTVNKK